MKKLLSVVVAVMMLFAFTSVAFAAVSDIAGHWAAADIQALIDKGVVSGDDTGKFNPEGKVTREQYAKMVVLAKGLAVENPATATFTDVPKTAWSFGYVEAAAKAGLINGIGAGKFAPAANITRQDVAVIVARALKLDTTGTPDFTDAASIAAYAKGSVAAAAKAGIVKGADGKFNPTATATRAEASVMTLRQVNYVAPVAANVLTKALADTYPDVEIGGKLYSSNNNRIVLKIGTKYLDDSVANDRALFIKGISVVASFGDSNKIVTLEGTPKIVEGKLESRGANADGDTVTVAGQTLTYVKAASRKGAITYDSLALSSSYKFLLNADGKVYGALSSVAAKKSGAITAIGVKKTDDKDQYYIALDGTVYNLKKDSDPAARLTGGITLDGATPGGINATWNLLNAKKAATIELDAEGYVVKVTAFTKSVTGTTTNLATNYILTKDMDGNNKWAKNVIQVGTTYIGENTTQALAEANAKTDVAGVNELIIASSVTITIDGTTSNLNDIKDGKNAKLTVNGEGIVTAIQIYKGATFGQVEAYENNSDKKLVSVTIGGVKYVFDGDATLSLNDNKQYQKAFSVLDLNLDTDGEISSFTSVKLIENVDNEVYTYTVVATPFEKGRPISGTDDTYAPGGKLRVMDADGGVNEVSITAAKLVKAGKEIKIQDIKKTDVIASNGDLSDASLAGTDYLVVAPILK